MTKVGMKGVQREYWTDLFLIFFVGIIIIVLLNRGWKSQEFHSRDTMPYYQGATEFLQTGALPEKGDISSYASWNPPGTFLLLIPGMLLTNDMRVQGMIANAILFLGTLLFFYLAARELTGRKIAVVAAIALAISRMGFQGIWPIGHPVFIAGMAYFLSVWVKRKSTIALALALGLGGFGLYVDLAILPMYLVVPCLWILFRPPVGGRSLLVVMLALLALWFPYLRFESHRGFVDMASLLLRRPVNSVWESATPPVYCYATAPGEPDVQNDIYIPYLGGTEIEARVVYPEAGWKNQIAYGSCRFLMNIDRNFDHNLFLDAGNVYLNRIIWWFFLSGLAGLAFAVLRYNNRLDRWITPIAPRTMWVALSAGVVGALLCHLLFNPDWIGFLAADGKLDRNIYLAIKQFQEFLPWIWTAVMAGLFFSGRLNRQNPEDIILAICILIPWLCLVFLAEPGRPERFWYLWPLQILTLVHFLCRLMSFCSPRRAPLIIAITALWIALFPAASLLPQMSQWMLRGYSGDDSDQWQTMAYIAQQVHQTDTRTARITYYLSDYASAVDVNAIGESDLFTYLLNARYGIRILGEASSVDGHAGWLVVDTTVLPPPSPVWKTPPKVIGRFSVFRIP